MVVVNKKTESFRSDQGSAVIEMAVSLPPALLFTFGLLYFCLVLFGYAGAVFGTRAAARYGALHSTASLKPATTASITTIAKSYVLAGPTGGTTVNVTYSGGGNTIGNTVLVNMTLNFPSTIPFMRAAAITVGSTAQRTITR